MSTVREMYLIREREELDREIDRLERKYRALKRFEDATELATKRSRLWDVDEALRVLREP